MTAAALLTIGASAALANTALTGLRQAHAPPGLLGRVVAATRTIIAATGPAAALAGGALATTGGLRAPPLASAVLLTIAVAVLTPALLRPG